jgi:hypothetical protein
MGPLQLLRRLRIAKLIARRIKPARLKIIRAVTETPAIAAITFAPGPSRTYIRGTIFRR